LLGVGGAALASASKLLLTDEAIASTVRPDVRHGHRSRAEVALTFHGAGELSIARSILAIAKETQTPITVMAVGTWLNTNPKIGSEIVDLGHDLGNHTYSHKTMTALSLSEAKSEVSKGKLALIRSVGRASEWFRPSGTQRSNSIIRTAAGVSGYTRCISFDVDSLDYQDPSVSSIIANCKASMQNGSIVSLHFGHLNTVAALPKLIQTIHEMKLTPVSISTLLRP
jgi:peptidoglycan/xylan/chitin deacetylase (PgdA/CDA1 family)